MVNHSYTVVGAEPGVYEHYKGGLYLCLGVARNPDKPDEDVVVYKPLYITPDRFFARLTYRDLKNGKDGWLDQVEAQNFATQTRFRYIAQSI